MSDSGHWYRKDGTPRYTNDNGKPTTLRDARKEGLFPSVTTIAKLLGNPAIEKWKMEQAVRAALEFAKKAGDGKTQYLGKAEEDIARIMELSYSASAKARNFGTEMHSAIEYIVQNMKTPPAMSSLGAGPTAKWHADLLLWLETNIAWVYTTEQCVTNSWEGYAGRVDLMAEHKEHGRVVIDFKTQAIKGGKPTIYDEWIWQLAAYAACNGGECHCMSVVIDSNKPGTPHAHLWTPEETARGWEVFNKMFDLWKCIKRFDPSKDTGSNNRKEDNE